MSEPNPSGLVNDAVVNMRVPLGFPVLMLDGVPFPYLIDKKRGVKVEAVDNNVHLVTVSIQIDRSVTVIDHATVNELGPPEPWNASADGESA